MAPLLFFPAPVLGGAECTFLTSKIFSLYYIILEKNVYDYFEPHGFKRKKAAAEGYT